MSHVDQALRGITEMFIAGLDHFSDEQVEQLDVELNRLVGIVETNARAELSRNLAPLAHAPACVMRRLAFDEDIAVAGPVLGRSPLLTSSDLAYLARSRGSDHLAAICERPVLDVAVTEALLERGDAEISRKVAAHPGVDLSLSGYGMLIGRAHRDEALAVSVGSRADIPVTALKALLSHVDDEVRARIRVRAEANAAKGGNEAVRRVLAEPAAARQVSSDFSRAHGELLGLHQAGAITDATLHKFASESRYEHAVVALSLLTDVPAELVEQVFRHSLKALLVPCRAADLTWPTVVAMMKLCSAIHATTKLDFDGYRATYVGMTRPAALSVLRYWVVAGPAGTEAARSQQAGQAPRRIANRRRAARHHVHSPATVMTVDGLPIVTGLIVDVSAGGAKIELAQAMAVPEQVVLLLSTSRDTRRVCDVMWRSDKAIGVQFLPPGRGSDSMSARSTTRAARP